MCHPSDGRRALMGGNWKLNPATLGGALALAEDLATQLKGTGGLVDTVVFPPFPLLPSVHANLAGSGISLGAQDVFYETTGAYTGAVSGA
ncbi:hypothetical protein EON63_20415 [archaeon]|nr:MAG: hypothetical protein EON63_20415 [archaeon]